MALKNSIAAVPLKTFASASLTGTYQPINAGGLTKACFTIRLMSTSSTDVTISYDGTTDNDYLVAGTTLQLPNQSNGQPNNFIASFPSSFTVWVKGTAGTGNLYLSGYYQPQV